MEQSNFTKRFTQPLCIGLLAAVISAPAFAADLIVNISSVEQSKGDIMIAVFDSEGTFNKERSVGLQAKAVEGDMEFTFNDLPEGEYAVMLFHDVNGNGTLDSNLLGIPKEPWGASLQGKKVFGAPGWKDVRFEMPAEDLTLVININ